MTAFLQNAARLVARVPRGWAGYCPGLLLAEMRHLVSLAHVDRLQAQRLAERLVSTRQRIVQVAEIQEPNSDLTRDENLLFYADAINAYHMRAIRRIEQDGVPAITATEGVATAILLTHAHLLVHLDTIEPVNCLGAEALHVDLQAVSPDQHAPVLLNDGATWDPGYSAGHIALLMMHLMNHETDVNDDVIFPSLRIDRKSRDKAENLFGGSQRDIANHRRINKSLAMELLTCLMLSRLNSARYVRPYCDTQNGQPHAFAGGGLPDVEARYDEPPPGFHVIVAASAKRSVTREFYGEQLEQVIAHGDAAAEAEKVPVYALVLNGGDVLQKKGLNETFRNFAEAGPQGQSGQVNLVPLYAPALALGMRDLEDALPADAFRFDAPTLANVFQKLTAGALEAHQDQGEDHGQDQGSEQDEEPDRDAARRVWTEVVTGKTLPKPKPRRKKKKKDQGPSP